jgi:tryptophan-rich sensory protein
VYGYISAYSTVLHSLLEVTDHAGYGMKSGVAHNIMSVILFFIYLQINPNGYKSLVVVNIIWTVLAILFLIIDLLVVKKKKWFDDFWKGKRIYISLLVLAFTISSFFFNIVSLTHKTMLYYSIYNFN